MTEAKSQTFTAECFWPGVRETDLRDHCLATPGKQSHAIGGTCFTGSKAFRATASTGFRHSG
jgi:hypothetical protein